MSVLFLQLIFAIFWSCEAFWWHSSSTEAPSPLMKQIPLTYFRTYTYQQPLTNNPIQLPLLSSTDYISNYNSLSNTPYFNPMMPVVPMSLATNNEIPVEVRPVKGYGNFNVVRSLGPLTADATEDATTTTITTTTTTTTPEPTTTTTTSTTTPAPSTTKQMSSTSSPTAALDNAESTYPAFNRKAFTNHFNINYNRPVYPYPEYSSNRANSPNEKTQAPPNIEFVPCMCPINIQTNGFSSAYQTGLPMAGSPSNSLFLAQGRTNAEAVSAEEDFLEEPVANIPLNNEIKAVEEASNSVDDLQAVKSNEDEAEEEDVDPLPENILT